MWGGAGNYFSRIVAATKTQFRADTTKDVSKSLIALEKLKANTHVSYHVNVGEI